MPVSQTHERLFQSPLVGNVVVDGDGRIRSANPAFARFTRYTAQQLEGLALTTLLHPDSLLPPGEEPVRLRFRDRAGRTLWGDACFLPLDGGNEEDLLLQVCDCTRAHFEQQLHKGRAEVLELLYCDHSLPAICEAIVRSIEAFGEGVRGSILLLDPGHGTLHLAAAPNLPDFYNAAIDGMRIGDGVGSCGTAVFRGERVVVADIRSHPYWERARRLVARTPMRACWSEPIVANDQRVLGSFALYYDSPREPLPEELELITAAAALTAIAIDYKRNEEKLRDLDRAKDEFISTAAHELRTPLTAILGYAELLIEGKHPRTEELDFATEIFLRGETLERLIGDLHDASTIQIGRDLLLQQQNIDLKALAEQAVAHFRRTAPRHGFELQCGPGLPSLFSCDPGRITQVFENLLGNAIKYSPNGGSVVIAIEKQGDEVRFSVTDQGIGMSANEQLRAFDKFYRADSSNSAPGGLGLGLCIVRRIVEGHGGEIRIKSAPGAGTAVTFTLPLPRQLSDN